MPLDRRLIRTALVATTLACATGSAGAQESLDALLEPHLAKHGLPAVAAAVTVGGKVVAAGAAGTR